MANSQTSKEAGQARTGLMRKHGEEMWSEIMELSKDMEFYSADCAMASALPSPPASSPMNMAILPSLPSLSPPTPLLLAI